jgi:hypothetical protein
VADKKSPRTLRAETSDYLEISWTDTAAALGSSLIQQRRLISGARLEFQLLSVLAERDLDVAAVHEFAEQQFFGQRALDELLDARPSSDRSLSSRSNGVPAR